MTWGKLGALAVALLTLVGCSNTTPRPTPSPTVEKLVVKKITGDAEADRIIAILKSSCDRGKRNGLETYITQTKKTIWAFPQPNFAYSFEWWSQMVDSKGKTELGGWVSGDIVCYESIFAERVVPAGSKPNAQGVTFNYKLVKINDTTFDWSMHRESPDFGTARYTIEGETLKAIRTAGENPFDYQISYGPFPSDIQEKYQKALIAANAQYMYLTPPMYGMTLEQAKAYCKKNGLTLLVAGEDEEMFYPSGPPGGKSDPKRMMVNILNGQISGVWTF